LKKKVLLLTLYSIFVIYSLELLVTFFLTKQDTNINVLDQREEKAKNFGILIDRRPYFKVFEKQNKSKKLRHEFRLNMSSIGVYKNILTKLEYIPLKGPVNSYSLGKYSNENGNYKIYKNDKYGFRNDNKIYDKKISVAIIGDSFAEGIPLNQSKNVSSILISKYNLNSANFGIAGSSLITYYAVFKEYIKNLEPENVIFFYYEGNDFLMLDAEKNSFLFNYLDKNYSQNLFYNSNQVNNSLKTLETYTHNLLLNNSKKNKEYKKEVYFKKEKIKDFLEIQNLREIFKIDFSKPDYSSETDLFKKIIMEVNQQTLSWGGKLIFVYVPSWGRYNKSYQFEGNNAKQIFELKDMILNYLEDNSINYIDVDSEILNLTNNPSKYYNFEFYGHMNYNGYMLISDLINKKLN